MLTQMSRDQLMQHGVRASACAAMPACSPSSRVARACSPHVDCLFAEGATELIVKIAGTRTAWNLRTWRQQPTSSASSTPRS